MAISFTQNSIPFCFIPQTFERKKRDCEKEVPCCSKETKGYHHFPPTNVEAAKKYSNMHLYYD